MSGYLALYALGAVAAFGAFLAISAVIGGSRNGEDDE